MTIYLQVFCGVQWASFLMVELQLRIISSHIYADAVSLSAE